MHFDYFISLAEVGKLETPKLEGKYETGQPFLHRVFGYRGVTLFPWLASVYDRDVTHSKDQTSSSEEPPSGLHQVGREVKGQQHTYYQVLIDSRDCPHVVSLYLSRCALPNENSIREHKQKLSHFWETKITADRYSQSLG